MFGEDRITIHPTDPADRAEFAGKLPVWQRMASLLRSGPLSLAAVAEELGEKEDTVKKTVLRSEKRSDGLFTRIKGLTDAQKLTLKMMGAVEQTSHND